ncbi:MAG: hypothetical protein ABUL72_03230 [Armatimonadota bacterium]
MFNRWPQTVGLMGLLGALAGCNASTGGLVSNDAPKSPLTGEVKTMLKPALETWDPSVFVKRYTPSEVHDKAVALDIEKFQEAKAKFGKLVTLSDGEMVRRDPNDMEMTAWAFPILRYPAEFEKGPARVEVWVRVGKTKDEWTVDHFKVDAPIPKP